MLSSFSKDETRQHQFRDSCDTGPGNLSLPLGEVWGEGRAFRFLKPLTPTLSQGERETFIVQAATASSLKNLIALPATILRFSSSGTPAKFLAMTLSE
jgi:hypothetical protein